MTDKELQRLRRSELLEILLVQQKQIDSLKEELADAKEQLAERKIAIEKSGSIAEAALKLNGIFEAAQRAADQYLYSIGAATKLEAAQQTADHYSSDIGAATESEAAVETPAPDLSAAPEKEAAEAQQGDPATAGISRAKSRKRRKK